MTNKQLAKTILRCYKEERRYSIQDTGDKVVVSFAGTMSWDDVLTDIKKYGNSEYHKGMRDLYEELANIIKSLLKNNKPHQVTGHSLGGALARYLAKDLQGLGFDVELVTFGEPKCVSESLHITNESRIVNGNDIVPRLGWFKLKHYSKAIKIGKAYFWRFWKREPIDDHFLKHYWENL